MTDVERQWREMERKIQRGTDEGAHRERSEKELDKEYLTVFFFWLYDTYVICHVHCLITWPTM